MPDKQLTDHTFLETLAGQYMFPGDPTPTTHRASWRSHTLIMSQPGAPETRASSPRRGTTFNLKGLEGYSIEFQNATPPENSPKLAFYTPDTVLIIQRK